MNAQHSKESNDWGTPVEVIECARRVLGDVRCDPCSSAYWNQRTVHASSFFDEERSALNNPNARGFANYFINAPGGWVKEFFSFAQEEAGHGSDVFWVGFSIEQLAYLQRDPWLIMSGGNGRISRVILPRRLAFLRSAPGMIAYLKEKAAKAKTKKLAAELLAQARKIKPSDPPFVEKGPTHSNYLALLSGDDATHHRFADEIAATWPDAKVF